jgi:hypothetical protein
MTEAQIITVLVRLLKGNMNAYKWILKPSSAAAREFFNNPRKLKQLLKTIDLPKLTISELREKFIESLKNLLNNSKAQQMLRREINLTDNDSSSDSCAPVTKQPKLTKENLLECETSKAGMTNLGSTCFINSAIQALFNINAFTEYLEKLPASENHIIKFLKYTHLNYFKLSGLNDKKKENERKLFLKMIYDLFAPQLMAGFKYENGLLRHSDPSELIDIIIQSLPTNFQALFNVNSALGFTTKLNTDEFRSDNFSKTVMNKLIENGLTSENRLPPYLMLACNRIVEISPQTYVKDQSFLNLKLNLSLNGQVYELMSVLSHIGHEINSGHWIAYCKNRENSFFELNDEEINTISFRKVQEDVGNGFGLLIYKLVESQSFIPMSSASPMEVSQESENEESENQFDVETENKLIFSIKLKYLCEKLFYGRKEIKNCIKLIEKSVGRKLTESGRTKVHKHMENLRIQINLTKNLLHKKKKTCQYTMDLFYKNNNYDEDKKYDVLADYFVDEIRDENDGNNQTEITNEISPHDVSNDSAKSKVGRRKIEKISEMGETLKKKAVLDSSKKIGTVKVALEIAKKLSKKLKLTKTSELLSKVIDTHVKGEEENLLKKLKQSENFAIDAWEAYVLILKNGFSVRGYKSIRKLCVKKGFKGFPSYQKLLKFKDSILPEIKITDTSASVSVQELSDITARSLIDDVLGQEIEKRLIAKKISKDENLKAKMLYTWGEDGSSLQQRYNQGGVDGRQIEDNALIAATMVPVQLIIERENGEKIFAWKNLHSASCFWNRTISLVYHKETDEMIIETYDNIQDQIKRIISHKYKFLENYNLEVCHNFHLSMIDGRVIKVLTRTRSFMQCPICNALPNDMNVLQNLENGKFNPINKAIRHTIAPLHTIMNVMLCLYHLACRKGIKKWRVMSDEDKLLYEENRLEYRQKLWDEFKVRFDEPSKGGGNSMNGSVCRKLFRDPVKLARVLELDEELVCRLAIILKIVNCKFDIDPEKFEKYATYTYKLFVKKYVWYKMPCNLHKLLAHGAYVMRTSPLPIGLTSEESQESKNKLYRNFRQFHARKTSREDNIKDVFTRAFLLSDPFVANYDSLNEKKNTTKYISTLPKEIQEFFVCSDEDREKSSNESEDEDEDETQDIFEDLDHCNVGFFDTDEDQQYEEMYNYICKKNNYRDDVNYD